MKVLALVESRTAESAPQFWPKRLAVEWQSGRIDLIEIEHHSARYDSVVIELRQLCRKVSESSESIKRAWLEDREGRLLYSAVNGRGQPQKKESPMG